MPDASRLSKLAGGCVPHTVVSVELEEGPMLIGNGLKAAPHPLRLDLLPVHVEFETVLAEDGEWLIYRWAH